MKTKILASISGLLVTLISPLAVLVPQASAATFVWLGGGTGVEDTVAKTWTFDISDGANWVGGIAPTGDGHTLEFPANQAVVDPLDANTDDSEWKYVVNNDLAANTTIAGINFTGDVGADCDVIDDKYNVAGNTIVISGDISSTVTGTCAGNYEHRSVLDINITTSADVSISVGLENSVTPFAENTLTYGTHALSFCDVSDANRGTKYPYINSRITGTGTLTIACPVSWYPTNLDTFGDIVVESNTRFNMNIAVMGASATRTFTFKDGATFYINENLGKTEEFKSNIVFVGTGVASGFCKTSECSGDDYETVTGYRGEVRNSTYDSVTKKTTYYGVSFTGDITLSGDTVLNLDSDTTLSGALTGDYSIASMPGYRGKLIINSSDNQSATPNGTIAPETYTKKLTDLTYDQYVGYGQEAELSTGEEIDDMIVVQEGGTLKGSGTVAGIDVQTGGKLAPGLSPGCIVSNGDLTLAGSYDVEIAGTTACTGYDQTDVTGAVDVSGGTLNVAFLNSFVPALNDQFVIIKNDAADAVTGTFTGLALGASIVVGGVTFQISYTGGDGNDVVLTATAVPAVVAAPDTGVGQLLQNPFTALIALMLSAGVLVGIRKTQLAK